MTHSRFGAAAICFLSSLASACGGTPTTPGVDAAGTDTGTVPVDTGTTTGGDPVDIRVLELDETPIAGAVVALDRPGGARTEAMTNADGIARFEVDWANGPFDFVAWAAGFTVRAMVRRDRALYESAINEGALTIYLVPATQAETITVSGTITGRASATTNFYVYNTASFSNSSGRADTFMLEIPPSTPFQILVLETDYRAGTGRDFTNSAVRSVLLPEQPGSATDITLDIDLSTNTVTPIEVMGSFVVPAVTTSDTFFDTAQLYVTVFNGGDVRFAMGGPTLGRFVESPRSVEYGLQYVLPAAATEPQSFYALVDGDRRSQATRDGVPVAGPQALDLLPVPEVRELSPGTFPRVFDNVVLLNAVDEASTGVVFSNGGYERYRILAPAGAGHVVIPPLPTGAEAAGILEGGVSRQVTFCVLTGTVPSEQYCERFASGYNTPADP